MAILPCPSCHTRTGRHLEATSRGAVADFFRCLSCGNVWAVPKPRLLSATPAEPMDRHNVVVISLGKGVEADETMDVMAQAQPTAKWPYNPSPPNSSSLDIMNSGVSIAAMPLKFAISLKAPAALTLARVAGVALVALALTCWLTRDDGRSRAARGLVAAMALYHTGVAIVLAYASFGLGLSGQGLWPTVSFHAAMTVWCLKTSRLNELLASETSL